MKILLETPLFGISLTLILWLFALWVRSRVRRPILNSVLNPVLLSIGGVIGVLLLLGVPYAAYDAGGKMISFLLGPAVVALAIPIHDQIRRIAAAAPLILTSVVVGSATGVLTAAGTVLLLGGSERIVRTVAPKSVTTAIAISISQKIGGVPEITAVIVIVTGVIGATIGPSLLRRCGVTKDVPLGLAIGAAAHGIGTARAFEESQTCGTYSGISMALTGIVTTLILPFLLRLLL